MSIVIHDSARHMDVPLDPVIPGKVSIYVCGATVQGPSHIGHIRCALAFDVIVRWLKASGYEVTMVRNVTDIDDKILAKSAQAQRPWWAHAAIYERDFSQAYRALGLLEPTYEPRATGHMTDMVEFIEELLRLGHAYRGQGANVYFDVSSFARYGEITNQGGDVQSNSGSQIDGDDNASDKRDPRDFALWKAAKPTEPASASWPSPWGRGRPAWHLECSAMSGRYLGDEFDIHAGGIDLRFPHHENEQAQSWAIGRPFARHWMHNAWVTIKGEKMSKSLGNALNVSEIIKRVPAPVLRYALVTVHYRSTVEYGEETLADAQAAWDRLNGFVQRSIQLVGEQALVDRSQIPVAFCESLDNDLNLAGAMAAIFEQLRLGNTALAAGDETQVAISQSLIRSMLDVLGIDPVQWQSQETTSSGTSDEIRALERIVSELVAERQAARLARDWAKADELRDKLKAAGIIVEDGADGVRWHVEHS